MKPYGKSTEKVLQEYEYTTNPVTRASLRAIIGNRIDKAESFRLELMREKRNQSLQNSSF